MRTIATSLAALFALPAGAAAYTLDPEPPAGGWYRGPVTVVDGERRVRVAAEGVHDVEGATVRIDRTRPALSARRRGRTVTVEARDELAGAVRLRVRVGRRPWRTRSLEEVLFDGTPETFERWQHAGAGEFSLVGEGAMRSAGGIGLLWFPGREFGDAVFRLQWREARGDGVSSNGGVFVRFPPPPPTEPCDAQLPLALYDFTWHAVACGHELQINDGDTDPQRTGSVYAFKPLDAEAARPAPFGVWNDYEVRTAGGGSYEIHVVRNGYVINRFVNTPGQRPIGGAFPGSLYPGTDAKQYASGHFGLQNHGDADVVDYRDVRALPLGAREVTFAARRSRVVRIRAVDAAGNRSRVVRLSPR